MNHYVQTVVKQILDYYDNLTKVEKDIADFFINNNEELDLSSKSISARLYVSEASLSRFAKKCGFKGYRDFIYQYERYLSERRKGMSFNDLTKKALAIYQELLNQNIQLINEAQMGRISKILANSGRVLVFGMGSSGIVAEEFKLRFMRLGLVVETAQDSHRINIYSSLVNSDMVVIGISLSGKTKEVLDGLRIAKKRGAKVIMITANESKELEGLCDEVVRIASTRKLEYGIVVSPQFPILVMVDIFYAYFLNTDMKIKAAQYTKTLSALKAGNKKSEDEE